MKAKIFHLDNNLDNDKKINLETCKRNININGNSYTDAEILKIRDYLYQLAEIECRYFKEWQVTYNDNVIPIKPKNNESEKSIPLYPCKHRRAG